MVERFVIVPPITIEVATARHLDRWADCDGAIIFEGVQPNKARAWYHHCYGVRGFVRAVHGSFERTYFFSPDYVDGNLREHLESTIVSLWAVIRSELEAAIREPMSPVHSPIVQEALARWSKTHGQRPTPALSEEP